MTVEAGTLAAWAGVIVTLGVYHFGVISKIQADLKEIQTKVDVFWLGASKKMAEFLISPHTPELDEVLRKFVRHEALTVDDLELAIHGLDEDINELKPLVKPGRADLALRLFVAETMKARFETELDIKLKRPAHL